MSAAVQDHANRLGDLKDIAGALKSGHPGGSAVPRGSDAHKADQAVAQYAEAVAQETDEPKNTVLQWERKPGTEPGIVDPDSIRDAIRADASAAAQVEARENDGRVPADGAAAAFERAGAKLNQAVDRAVEGTGSFNHLDHAADIKNIAQKLKAEHPGGSVVPRGSAAHKADQALAQYTDAVAKELGIPKQEVQKARHSDLPRGALDGEAVVAEIRQDAKEASRAEQHATGRRQAGGVAAEFQSAADKLAAAISQKN